MKWRATMLVICVAAGLQGCAAFGRRGVDDLSRPVGGEVLPADMLAEAVPADGPDARAVRRVAEADGARVFALRVQEGVPAYRVRRTDQVFFVVAGEGIASVAGQRRIVGPGSVVVAPRRKEVKFVRSEEQVHSPLLMALVVVPYGPPPKGLAEALIPPDAPEAD